MRPVSDIIQALDKARADVADARAYLSVPTDLERLQAEFAQNRELVVNLGENVFTLEPELKQLNTKLEEAKKQETASKAAANRFNPNHELISSNEQNTANAQRQFDAKSVFLNSLKLQKQQAETRMNDIENTMSTVTVARARLQTALDLEKSAEDALKSVTRVSPNSMHALSRALSRAFHIDDLQLERYLSSLYRGLPASTALVDFVSILSVEPPTSYSATSDADTDTYEFKGVSNGAGVTDITVVRIKATDKWTVTLSVASWKPYEDFAKIKAYSDGKFFPSDRLRFVRLHAPQRVLAYGAASGRV